MPLLYRFLADTIVVIHAAYVLFVVGALPLILLGGWRGWSWVRNLTCRGGHLGMILLVVLESWAGITCPLTTREQWLREWSAGRTYRGDFIANLVHDGLFVDAPPWAFTLVDSLLGAAVLSGYWCVPPRRRTRPMESTTNRT